jgi:hypothetical protein
MRKPARRSSLWSYSKRFVERLREEALGWARDNILLGVVMLVLPPAAVYLRDHNAKLDWGTIRMACGLYVAIFAIYIVAQCIKTAWVLDDDRIEEITTVEEARRAGRQKLEEIEKTTPKIKLKQPGAIYTEPVSLNVKDVANGTVYSWTVPFLKVRFINEPIGPYPSAKANDVRATINYYRVADGVQLLSIDGRWAESTQPSAIPAATSKTHLLPTTFGIGEAHSLDIAYRDSQTGEYFAWNNDNYNYPLLRNPHHLLKGNLFRADIRLRGDWIDKTFAFTFKTTDTGFEI